MAWQSLQEELDEALGYGAGVFDLNWASGAKRSVQDGYSYRDTPGHSRETDGVSTAEIATWRKRMPLRFVRPAETEPLSRAYGSKMQQIEEQIARRAQIEKARAERRTARRAYHYAHNVASMARRANPAK